MSLTNGGVRLIFVGGSPRSGTTLLQNILDSHPDIFGGPEFLHLPDIIDLRTKLHRSLNREWITLYCSHEQIDAKIRAFIESFFSPVVATHQAKFLSEKTPENVLVFSELAELFPEARFIHVVRDPRAIVASMLEVGARAREKKVRTSRFTYNIHEAIQYLQKCLDAGFRAGQAFPDKVLTVRYERLVTKPEQEIRKICNHLGVDWHPAMMTPADQRHYGEHAITVKSDELWYDRQTYYSNPNTTSLEKWKRTLTPAQQIAVINAFGDNGELQALGYELSSTLGVGAHIVGTLLHMAFTLRYTLPRKFRRVARRSNMQPG